MTDNSTPNYEIPTEMRDFAEKSLDQARKAMDGFLGAAHRAVDSFEGSTSSLQTNAKDITRRTLAVAEQNIQATFEHAQRLVRAKDPTEAMRLQAEFLQSQFAAMQTQLREFGGTVQAAATGAARSAAPTAAPTNVPGAAPKK